MEYNKFIVPPDLSTSVRTFENHYAVAEQQPIMIVGPTGVGKSLFLHVFEQLYLNEADSKDRPIKWANCSHFGGVQSDPNVARSELFGHKKGSFTGATGDRVGLVKAADKGVLILEEIGELPLEVQAMLLTFVETGKYLRIGENKEYTAAVRIIGSTNNEESLREDFRFRFFPFYVPPLRMRRGDVLYYFAAKFPELLPSLRTWEILSLLAYNWPGNVREVERIGRLILRNRHSETSYRPPSTLDELAKRTAFSPSLPDYFFDLDCTGLGGFSVNDSQIHGSSSNILYHKLVQKGIDADLLDKTLNEFNIGLYHRNCHQPFEKIGDIKQILFSTQSGELGLTICQHFEAFEKAAEGLRLFCSIFYLDEYQDHNLLDVHSARFWIPPHLPKYFLGKLSKKRSLMFASILQYVHKLRLQAQEKKTPQDSLDIFAMSQEDLLNFYYKGLLDRTHGNKAEAARRAGLNDSTFRFRIKKLEVNRNI